MNEQRRACVESEEERFYAAMVFEGRSRGCVRVERAQGLMLKRRNAANLALGVRDGRASLGLRGIGGRAVLCGDGF